MQLSTINILMPPKHMIHIPDWHDIILVSWKPLWLEGIYEMRHFPIQLQNSVRISCEVHGLLWSSSESMDVIIQILQCKYQTCLILSGQFWWVSEQFRRLKSGSVNLSQHKTHYQIICAKQHCTHWMLIWKCWSEVDPPPNKRVSVMIEITNQKE